MFHPLILKTVVEGGAKMSRTRGAIDAKTDDMPGITVTRGIDY